MRTKHALCQQGNFIRFQSEYLASTFGMIPWAVQTKPGVNPYMQEGACMPIHSADCPTGILGFCPKSPYHPREITFMQQPKICGERLPGISDCYRPDKSSGLEDEVKCLPKVFIIGIMKSGTTALFDGLTRHPKVHTALFGLCFRLSCLLAHTDAYGDFT